MKYILLLFCIIIFSTVYAQNKTDISLFIKKEPAKQLHEVYSETPANFKANKIAGILDYFSKWKRGKIEYLGKVY